MMRELVPVTALLLFFSPLALASQTACVFASGPSPDYYEIEFIEGDAKPMIVFSSTVFGSGKRYTLSPENYELNHFDQKAGTVDLEFENPGDAALPPPFGLVGRNGRAWFKTGPTIVEGKFKCDQ